MNSSGRASRYSYPVIAFILVWALFLITTPLAVGVFDEGIVLSGALRVLGGELPSLDFYTNYGPAQFYFIACLFKTFGSSILVARAYDAFVLTSIIVVSWALIRRSAGPKMAVIAVCIVFMLLSIVRSPLYPVYPCLLLMLIGCFLLTDLLLVASKARAFIPLGMLCAVIALFRYDIGALAVLSFSLPIFIVRICQSFAKHGTLGPGFWQALCASVVIGTSVLAAFFALYLTGIFEPAILDIVTHISDNYVASRSLPFPVLADLVHRPKDFIAVYFPLFAISIGILTCTVFKRSGKNWVDSAYAGIVVLTSVTCFCYFKGMVRTSAIHMLLADIPAIILFLLCCSHVITNVLPGHYGPSFRMGIERTMTIGSLLAVICALFVVLVYVQKRGLSHFDEQLVYEKIPELNYFRMPPENVAALTYVRNMTTRSERVLSATGRHDKIYINDASFYYLVNRRPGTKWHHYDPGVQTSLNIQKEIVSDLIKNNVRVVVRNTSWDSFIEPNDSALSSGVYLLDQYLSENYILDKQFGNISVLVSSK